MALNPATIVTLVKEKQELPEVLLDFLDDGLITEELETWLTDHPDGTGGTPFVESLAQAVVEHLVAKGEITVMVTGIDGGISLPQAARLNDRVLGSIPTTPDAGLQNEIPPSVTPIPTTPAVVSSTLSIKGLID